MAAYADTGAVSFAPAAAPRRTDSGLDGGRIDLWLAPLSGIDDAARAECLRVLDDSEIVRWKRFLVHRPRDQYLVARSLVRTALSSYTGVPAHAWRFGKSRYGRPHVREPSEFRYIRFNVSHTDGLVVLAVGANREFGVDVENINRAIDADKLASHYFAPAEAQAMRRCRPDATDLFFALWTLKEAYLKARGIGFALPLSAFWFDLESPVPRLHCDDRCGDDPSRWQFCQMTPTAEHRLALAVAAPSCANVRVALRWVGERPAAKPALALGSETRHRTAQKLTSD